MLLQKRSTDAEFLRNVSKALVPRPQKSWRINEDRGNQVSVDQSDAQAVQTMSVDRKPYLFHLRHSHLRELVEQSECFDSLPQRSQGKFRNHKRMNDNAALPKLPAHLLVAGAEMVDPNRGIGQDHFRLVRRRGTLFKSGIVPPSDANRRALSRSIKALRASRSNAVFSATPVNSWAVWISSSSRATVVRIETHTRIIASFDAYYYALYYRVESCQSSVALQPLCILSFPCAEKTLNAKVAKGSQSNHATGIKTLLRGFVEASASPNPHKIFLPLSRLHL
jgi:hypothetical protein